jgi:hypothetical protein
LARAAFVLLELLLVVAILAALAGLVAFAVGSLPAQAEITAADTSLRALRDAFLGGPDAPGYLADMRHVPGFRSVQVRVRDLLDPSAYPAFSRFDPLAARGWRGPYVRGAAAVQNTESARAGLFPAAGDRRKPDDASFLERGFYADAENSWYGAAGDAAAADTWGNPIVLQIPPPEAFAPGASEAERFRYARLVSAGPDGILETPRDRLAGRCDDGTCAARGDDRVLFLNRADVYESERP